MEEECATSTIPLNINMEHNRGGLEDGFPFQLGEFVCSMFIFQGVLCDIGGAIRVTRDDVFSYEMRSKRTLEASKSQGSQRLGNFKSLASPFKFDSSPLKFKIG